MAGDAPRGPTLRELESLQISRAQAPAPKRRIMRALIALAVIAVAAAGGYELYLNTYGHPQEVRTAYVIVRRAGQQGLVLTGSGYIVTRQKYITVGAQVLGQIVAEPIQEGQHVKKGDLLARIDDRDYRARLQQAIADRDLAAADVRLKTEEARRTAVLYRAHVATKDQLEIAENAADVARADLEKAEGEINFARFNVNQCVIRSPVNGIVLKKFREIGSMINYGGDIQANAGTTDIAQVADTDDMRAEVDINESDIAKVRMGAPATVTLDSYPSRPFAAKVVKIYPAANRQKGTIKVEVHIVKPDLAIIKPEMSARVSFLAGRAPSGESQPLILVPRKAVVGQGDQTSVWVVRNSIARRVPIVIGREFQDGIAVKRGLDGGEMVIVGPPPGLRDGQPVTALLS